MKHLGTVFSPPLDPAPSGRSESYSEEVERLIEEADVAMYHAKARGGGQYVFFRPEMKIDGRGRRARNFTVRDMIRKLG